MRAWASAGVRLALVVALLLRSLAAHASPSANPELSLQQGRDAYARHDFKEVEQQVFPLLHPTIELGTEEAVVEAHKLLALSYFFQKKVTEARREVLALFVLRPGFKLDAFVEPPVAVSFFENIHKEEDTRLEEIKRRQHEEEEQLRAAEERKRLEARKKAERVYIERTVAKHSRLIAMIPFGIGQIQNGEKGLAALFASSEIALGLVSIGSWAAIQYLFPNAKIRSDSDQQLAVTLSGLQLASGAAFWGMLVAGIVDAQVKFKPEVVVKTRELPPQAPPKPKIQSWNVSPMVGPGLFGLGLQGAF